MVESQYIWNVLNIFSFILSCLYKMSEPFGEANNNNSVPTLAGYKINSGNIGDYVYKDSQFTLALTAGTGGGVPPGNYAWKR